MARGRMPPVPLEEPVPVRSLVPRDRIGERLRRISILTRRIEERLGEHLGINLTDLSAMEHLFSYGPLTPSDLASRLDVSTAASTHIVDRLERAGHVSRERDADDRRKVRVVATQASIARASAALAPLIQSLDAVMAGPSAAERAVIERFLDQLLGVYASELQRPRGTPAPSRSARPPRSAKKRSPSHD